MPPAPQRIVFHATGGEYFRIWIVNLLLTIVTLGIYSAWAKVRRNQYFYSSTELAGASFEYHGNPLAILKGRIIALMVFSAYSTAARFSPIAGGFMGLLLLAVGPWFIWKSLQFRLHNTSYRGIRFRFDGSLGGAYQRFLLYPLLNLFTLMLGTPLVHRSIKQYQHGQARFGQAQFGFDASIGGFYRLYGIGLLLLLAGLVPMMYLIVTETQAGHAGTVWLIALALYAWLFMVTPLAMAMSQQLIWNHTSLEQHRLRCSLRWGRLAFIMLTNYLAILCTLGLFIPFAKVRMLRYRLESMELLALGSLDEFVAASAPAVGAAGEGLADVMDFDLSI
ncbi:MAG: YjgN family protein [Sphingomonadaceae bacterium]